MNNCKCPYCGKHVPYFTALAIRRQGEYYCRKCKKESNIYIKKTIWILFFCVLILALVILGFFLFMTNRENVLFTLLIAIPFIIFYICSPMFVRLRPKKKFQDSLYDTEMVNSLGSEAEQATGFSVKPTTSFMNEIGLSDEEYRSSINADVFNAIKEERKAAVETDGGTRAFDKFENISSDRDIGNTKMVGNLKNISDPDYSESYYDL